MISSTMFALLSSWSVFDFDHLGQSITPTGQLEARCGAALGGHPRLILLLLWGAFGERFSFNCVYVETICLL